MRYIYRGSIVLIPATQPRHLSPFLSGLQLRRLLRWLWQILGARKGLLSTNFATWMGPRVRAKCAPWACRQAVRLAWARRQAPYNGWPGPRVNNLCLRTQAASGFRRTVCRREAQDPSGDTCSRDDITSVRGPLHDVMSKVASHRSTAITPTPYTPAPPKLKASTHANTYLLTCT